MNVIIKYHIISLVFIKIYTENEIYNYALKKRKNDAALIRVYILALKKHSLPFHSC